MAFARLTKPFGDQHDRHADARHEHTAAVELEQHVAHVEEEVVVSGIAAF